MSPSSEVTPPHTIRLCHVSADTCEKRLIRCSSIVAGGESSLGRYRRESGGTGTSPGLGLCIPPQPRSGEVSCTQVKPTLFGSFCCSPPPS